MHWIVPGPFARVAAEHAFVPLHTMAQLAALQVRGPHWLPASHVMEQEETPDGQVTLVHDP